MNFIIGKSDDFFLIHLNLFYMKNLKLSKLSNNQLDKRQMKNAKGGQNEAWPFCFIRCNKCADLKDQKDPRCWNRSCFS